MSSFILEHSSANKTLPHGFFLDLSRFQGRACGKQLYLAEMMNPVFVRVENIVGKGDHAGN